MWLNLSFSLWAQIFKNGCQITTLKDAQGHDLAPIFGDLSQSKKNSATFSTYIFCQRFIPLWLVLPAFGSFNASELSLLQRRRMKEKNRS